VFYIIIIIVCYLLLPSSSLLLLTLLLLLILKRAFKWASRRVNLTKQPPLLPDRLKEGCLFEAQSGCKMDRGE